MMQNQTLSGQNATLAGQVDKLQSYRANLETQFSIRSSTATGILQLMEKNELILREPVESDARLKKLVLTEKALDIHKMVEEDRKRTEEQLTKDIDAQELAIFRKVLKQMIRNME